MIQEEVVERLPRKKLVTASKTGRIGKEVEQLTNGRRIDNFNLKIDQTGDKIFEED